jgi:hypothetical protein
MHLDNLCSENQLDALFSLIYFAKQPLHVPGIFIAHHQEVYTVHVQQLVRVVHLGDWLLAGSGLNWFCSSDSAK